MFHRFKPLVGPTTVFLLWVYKEMAKTRRKQRRRVRKHNRRSNKKPLLYRIGGAISLKECHTDWKNTFDGFKWFISLHPNNKLNLTYNEKTFTLSDFTFDTKIKTQVKFFGEQHYYNMSFLVKNSIQHFDLIILIYIKFV
jgi:hypothetical protein